MPDAEIGVELLVAEDAAQQSFLSAYRSLLGGAVPREPAVPRLLAAPRELARAATAVLAVAARSHQAAERPGVVG